MMYVFVEKKEKCLSEYPSRTMGVFNQIVIHVCICAV